MTGRTPQNVYGQQPGEDWRSWMAYAKRSKFYLTYREFAALGVVTMGAFVGAGVMLLKMTPEMDTQHLRKLPEGQRQQQQQVIAKMLKEADERSPTENIEAAIDAMGKFYGFPDSMQAQKAQTATAAEPRRY